MTRKTGILAALVSLFLLCLSVSAQAYDVAVITSAEIMPYNHALEGFRRVCPRCDVREIVLSREGPRNVIAKIREIRPDLVLSIGIDAYEQVKNIKDLPVVYAMIPNTPPEGEKRKNVSGVSMFVSPAKYLEVMLEVFPSARRIGLIYDPKNSGAFVQEALQTAKKSGIELVLRQAEKPGSVPLLIDSLRDKIDVFWMLPDATVINPETVRYMLLFSFQNRIPIFTFSKKYVEMGALAGLNVMPSDLGRQAGEIALRILSGDDPVLPIRQDARKTRLVLNRKVAGKLSLRIPDRVLREAEDAQ
jgi:putative ABC transport system substrate-binding protein